ncbi:MAG: hypothetical protein NTX50_01365, partial [Candidatus Sumerlaeota bacterium]|nr:hypothetical protein [Candidatus Sumerlaeota bacterium]
VLKKGGALIPNYVGMAVVYLLRRHFAHYVDIGFTALMEDELDEIASGKRNWQDFLSLFYLGSGAEGEPGLARSIEAELPKIEFPAIPIGEDPETGQPITARIGRNSAYVQRGEGGEGNVATIPYNVLIDELTPQKALEIIKQRAEGNKPLGIDPMTGLKVFALLGPYGPYVQLGENGNTNGNGDEAETPEAASEEEAPEALGEEDSSESPKSHKSPKSHTKASSSKSASKKIKAPKPKRNSVPRGVALENVTLEYALQLLSLPRIVGHDPATGKPIRANLGRFGPYIERDGEYRSLPTADHLFTITLDEAVARLAEEKRRKGKEVLKELGAHPESGLNIQALAGRYGPYVSDGKTHATLPRDVTPESMTLEQALALLSQSAEKKKTAPPRARRKKS